jgi:serine/threonine protein kinase
MSPPSQIGQYQVVEALPQTGKVRPYRAMDPASQRTVVLKTVEKNPADPEISELISQFKRQVAVSAGLQHPGIVQVYEYREDSGLCFVVLEYVEGCALQPRLRSPIGDAGSCLVQLLTALQYAHTNGVAHLNLAPGSLLLTSKGRLKIADFGGPDRKSVV